MKANPTALLFVAITCLALVHQSFGIPVDSKPFVLQNGKDAQALNAQFSGLDASSPCSDASLAQACVGTQFAQCVAGKFVLTQCALGTICASVPLVNRAGTSIVCTTLQDAQSRIAATGAGNSLNGDGRAPANPPPSGGSPPPQPSPPSPAQPAPPPSAPAFQAQNGRDAQALNTKFATFTSSTACSDGEIACVDKQFAQCVGGKFVLTPCGPVPLQCTALPLVNAVGTSITCTTPEDAARRFEAAGVGSSISSPDNAPAPPPPQNNAAPPAPPSSNDNSSGSPGVKPFALQNGKDAQALNRWYSGLSTSSTCSQDGEQVCISGQFAQCLRGSFVVTGCAAGTTCAAVPLVNNPGTAVVCTTADDALARIAATGAGRSLTG